MAGAAPPLSLTLPAGTWAVVATLHCSKQPVLPAQGQGHAAGAFTKQSLAHGQESRDISTHVRRREVLKKTQTSEGRRKLDMDTKQGCNLIDLVNYDSAGKVVN